MPRLRAQKVTFWAPGAYVGALKVTNWATSWSKTARSVWVLRGVEQSVLRPAQQSVRVWRRSGCRPDRFRRSGGDRNLHQERAGHWAR
jgi:hypothetical protein